MRKTVLYLYTLLAFSNVSAQSLKVSASKPVLIVHMPNPITVEAPGHAPSSLIVTTDNGKVEYGVDKTYFFLSPEKAGKAHVFVKTTSGKILGTKEFEIKPMPLPKAQLAGKTEGSISLHVVRPQLGIIAHLEPGELPFDARWKVTKFTLIVMRGGVEVWRHTNKGASFDTDNKNYLSQLQIDDIIQVVDISGAGPYTTGRLGNIILTVVK